MENILIVRRLGGRHYGDREHDDEQIPAGAVILVNGLGVVDAAIKRWDVKLGKANQGLDEQQDVGGEADNGVGGLEVSAVVAGLIVINDNKGSQESEKGSAVENRVDVSAESLLLGSMRGLEDQNGLDAEEDPGRVEQL